MRKSREYEKPQKQSMAPGVLIILLMGAAVYFFVAGSMGRWVGENVVTPVFEFFESEDFSGQPNDITDKGNNYFGEQADDTNLSEAETETITKNIKTPKINIYALQTGAYSDKTNAESSANSLKKQGGAGYVVKDNDLHRVLISYYVIKDQAVSVMARLDEEKGIKVREYPIEVESVNIEISANPLIVESIESGFELVSICFEKIQQMSFDYDASKLIECETTYNELLTELDNVIANIEQLTQGTDNDVVINQIALLNKYKDSLKDIDINGNDKVAISSKIKYTGIDMVYDYKELIENY